jgi:DNA repair exonuclease SbcCD ATPase subunit
MKLTSQVLRVSSSKRRLMLIVGGALLLVFLIIGYGLWSNATWGHYDKAYGSWSADAKQELSAVIQTKASNNQQRLDKISRIRETMQTMGQSAKTICRTNSLVEWQSFLDGLKKKEEDCRKHQDKITSFIQKLRPILTFLDDEQKVTKALDSVPKNADQLDEKTWESQVTALQNVLKTVDKLSVDSEALPLKQATQATLKENIASWEELLVAHKAKDRARYENAQVRLVKSYSSYGGLATVSTERIEKLVKALPSL